MLALLAYLAVEGSAPRARLAALFWPASSDRVGRNNLVHLLRRVASMSRDELVQGKETLALKPAVWTDVQASSAGDTPPELVPKCTFLEGVAFDELAEFEDWVHLQRERLLQRSVRQLINWREQAAASSGRRNEKAAFSAADNLMMAQYARIRNSGRLLRRIERPSSRSACPHARVDVARLHRLAPKNLDRRDEHLRGVTLLM
ncbi:hypothetical protein [Deinococcus yavapaiensis]|nr:hypothetical protein [Deinococcus yavapaiensis]